MNGRRAWSLAVYRQFDLTVRAFMRARALEAGASIAYYAFFSLFPAVIFLISLLGFFLKPEQVNAEVLKLLKDFFPVSADEIVPLIEGTLRSVIEGRGAVSVVAGIGLLWSGSNVFTVLVRNVNRAWGARTRPLNFLQSRLIAIAIILSLAGFVLLSLLATPLLKVLSHYEIGSQALHQTPVWWALAAVTPHLFSFLFFFALYLWVPKAEVDWRAAAAGAALAAGAWQVTIWVGTWAVAEGVINYKLVYGSLTTIVIALFWIYLSSVILLFGAHFSATLGQRLRQPAA